MYYMTTVNPPTPLRQGGIEQSSLILATIRQIQRYRPKRKAPIKNLSPSNLLNPI